MYRYIYMPSYILKPLSLAADNTCTTCEYLFSDHFDLCSLQRSSMKATNS